MKKVWQFIKNVLSSDKFLFLVLIFFALQCLWVAVSFKYPMVFDERYHVEVSEIYTHQLSPIINNQDPQFDIYGNLTFGSASLYHFLTGLIIRVIDLFHPTIAEKIISLRIISITLVSVGLYLFARVFRRTGLQKAIINLALLFLTTIPLFILISSTVSYDNLLFLLVAIFLSYAVKIIQLDKYDAIVFAKFILVGMMGSLVKFSFLPIFILGLMGLLTIVLCRGVGLKQLARDSIKSFTVSNRGRSIGLGVFLIVVTALFSFRYIYPTLRYHSPIPQCNLVMQENRCEKSGVYAYESQAMETKRERIALPIQLYAQNWSETILLQLDTSAGVVSEGKVEFGKSLPINAFLLTTAPILGLSALIYAWKSMKLTGPQRYLVGTAAIMVLTTFVFNAVSYYSVNLDLNVQTRYLLIPIFILLTFSLHAINIGLSDKYRVKLFGLVFVCLLLSQGGGVVKHLLTSEDDWYRQDKTVILINDSAKKLIKPWVKE